MSTINSTLSSDYLKSCLSYDPRVAEFRWAINRGKMKAGQIAGTTNGNGYPQVMINRKIYLSHRLAWLYIYGRFPDKELDHINGDRADFRIVNLRECSHAENHQNRGKQKNGGKSTSEFPGVYMRRECKKWVSQISADGKNYYLGMFEDEMRAREAYLKAKSELHRFQPVPREAQA